MIQTAIDKKRLADFMKLNFKWSSKNFKIKLKNNTNVRKTHSQSIKKQYKSYRINNKENQDHFSSYNNQIKEGRYDITTRIAQIMTKIDNKRICRAKDRDIVEDIFELLRLVFKNIPSFQKIIDNLSLYIFLDPVFHFKEILVLRQKCGFLENQRVTFRELFDNIDSFINNTSSDLKNSFIQLEESNEMYKNKIFKLESELAYHRFKFKDFNSQFSKLASIKKEKFDMTRMCIATKLKLKKMTKNFETVVKENNIYKRMEEDYNYFKIENEKKLKNYIMKNIKLKESIKIYEEAELTLKDKSTGLKDLNNKLNNQISDFGKLLLDIINRIKDVNIVEKLEKSPQKSRLSGIAKQVMARNSVINAFQDQKRNSKRFSVIPAELQKLMNSPQNTAFKRQSELNKKERNSKHSSFLSVNKESPQKEVKKSFFLEQKTDKEYSANKLDHILHDNFDYLSTNGMEISLRNLIFDVLKVVNIKFKRIQGNFINNLVVYNSL